MSRRACFSAEAALSIFPINPGGTLLPFMPHRKLMPAFSIRSFPAAALRTSSRLARIASMRALISSSVRILAAAVMQSPWIVRETTSFRSQSSPQYTSTSLMKFLAAASFFPGSLAAIWSTNVIALASYWPWSRRIGVEVLDPSTLTVTFQLNLTGKFSGSLMKMEIAPVS